MARSTGLLGILGVPRELSKNSGGPYYRFSQGFGGLRFRISGFRVLGFRVAIKFDRCEAGSTSAATSWKTLTRQCHARLGGGSDLGCRIKVNYGLGV